VASKSITLTIQVDGATELLRAFNRMPKDANNALRDASQELAVAMAGRVAASARAESSQAGLMAGTVKAKRDRIPVVEVGGSSRVGRNSKPAYKILFGSEFGSSRYKQFKPHLGGGSYWAFKTIEASESVISAGWLKAADEIVQRFGAG
jgi:hypothetical protein